LNKENKEKQLSQNILKTIAPDAVRIQKAKVCMYKQKNIHLYIEVHQSQQVRNSVQGIPSNVTSATCVYKKEAIRWLVASQ
jgi:hypothetical protein